MAELMLNGIGFVTGDPTLKLNYPQVTHPGMQITASAPGDLKWITMNLPLNKGSVITGVTITYKNSNARSYIKQVRLSEQTSPDQANVVYDNAAALNATTVTTKAESVPNVAVQASVNLDLRLFFANAADVIEIGAVEINYN